MKKTKNKTNIKNYMQGVRDFLTEEYGTVKTEWEITLTLLEDSLFIYEEIKESIKENGIYSGGTKNPLLSTLKDTQATILKLTQKLGISPYDNAKIKMPEEDNTESFINGLMGDDD